MVPPSPFQAPGSPYTSYVGLAFLGLVLKDTQIVDIPQANAAFESSNASAPKLTVPSDMKGLIAGYDAQWKDRLSAIARTVSTASTAPGYSYALDTLKTLPPVRPAVTTLPSGRQAMNLTASQLN